MKATISRFGILLITALLGMLPTWVCAGEAGRVVFVAGSVHIGARQIMAGDAIQEGDWIGTGADGYVYIKTEDNGTLILRPGSQASIVRYLVDRQSPANSRFKFELKRGVARHISGEAVKAARRNFRFNTPVAAIGVRGTDFTVITTQDRTQVSVMSGEVVASAFSATCLSAGAGPCESEGGQELMTAKAGQLLYIQRGQNQPSQIEKPVLTPEHATPRSDEPQAKGEHPDTSLRPVKTAMLDDALAAQIAMPIDRSPQILWGRWRPLLDLPGEVDLSVLPEGRGVLAINDSHVLLRDNLQAASWTIPRNGVASFDIQHAEAYVRNDKSGALTAGAVADARLSVDFATARFDTSLTVAANGKSAELRALGTVTPDGRMLGDPRYLRNPTNMSVSGALNHSTAAYLFLGRVDDQHAVHGVTAWSKH